MLQTENASRSLFSYFSIAGTSLLLIATLTHGVCWNDEMKKDAIYLPFWLATFARLHIASAAIFRKMWIRYSETAILLESPESEHQMSYRELMAEMSRWAAGQMLTGLRVGLPTGRFLGSLRKSFVAVASRTSSKEGNPHRGALKVTVSRSKSRFKDFSSRLFEV